MLGSSALAALISGIFAMVNNRRHKKTALEDGVQVLLYDRLKYLAKHYIGEGSIAPEDLEDIISMHDKYHNLRGNGFLDKLMNQVKALPIK
jgi:hypothetical protein